MILPQNLPRYLTSPIGRDGELAELRNCLRAHHLVTVIRPGGVGKARLAVELGQKVSAEFPGGVSLIDLAPWSGPDAVVSATAALLQALLTDLDAAANTIVKALGSERRFLIFDN